MSDFDVLLWAYGALVLVTIVGYLSYDLARLVKYNIKNGFKTKWEDVVWFFLSVVGITLALTPIATILCHNTWLHNNDTSY